VAGQYHQVRPERPSAIADDHGLLRRRDARGHLRCRRRCNDNAWLTSYGGKSIAVFDKNGKPLTPADGITFDGKLGLMQGVIVTPSGDVWVLGVEKNQLVYFPNGDLTKGKLLCDFASRRVRGRRPPDAD
jgi:hypothetical protein